MTFVCMDFVTFFFVTTALYWFLPTALRNPLLLVASCFFYASFVPWYLLVLIAIILLDYCSAILIERAADPARRWRLLIVSLAANLGVLAVFKYSDFLISTVTSLTAAIGWNYGPRLLGLVVPLGLSFHTFQSMAYTIEVYRGRQKAERNLLTYALYVLFYPQLVAGPIERPQAMLPQLNATHAFSYEQFTNGLKLMAWGFFKKLVIADRVAVLVNTAYANPADFSGLELLIATIAFSIQIYCDFSGYTDIATGAAACIGYRLSRNFNRPYAARSVAEFWKRWHISLSSWFRDYVYFYLPISGVRIGGVSIPTNVLTTFFLSGLWHGAGWTFVIWGLLHGAFITLAGLSHDFRVRLVSACRLDRFPRLLHALQVATTFALVTFAWIFFRAQSVSDAGLIAYRIGACLAGATAQLGAVLAATARLGLTDIELGVAATAVAILVAVQLLQSRGSLRAQLATTPFWFRWSLYVACTWATLLLGRGDSPSFIYFQF